MKYIICAYTGPINVPHFYIEKHVKRPSGNSINLQWTTMPEKATLFSKERARHYQEMLTIPTCLLSLEEAKVIWVMGS